MHYLGNRDIMGHSFQTKRGRLSVASVCMVSVFSGGTKGNLCRRILTVSNGLTAECRAHTNMVLKWLLG